MGFLVDQYYENTPIGYPANRTGAYVLDEQGNRVADGEVGELCLSGVFARGYIGLPEQTAAAFTANSFVAADGNAVLYHTGDMARWLPDGNLLYVNRKDWQVKIHGQRVELGEIELALTAFPHIDTAVVQAFTKANGQQYLCAYYQGTCEVERKALKAFLGEKLPLYMIPEYYIRLDQMPLNLNGKLDRSQLQAPEVQAYNSYRPPVTDLEKTLCAGFADVLKQKQIGLDSDFYLLGGDSLAAMSYTDIGQAVSRRDGPHKIRGQAVYTDDLQIPALLAVTVRSHVPCGKIKHIHVPCLPDGYSIVTAADIKGVNQCHFYTAKAPYLSQDEVRWLGEPVALLVGPDRRVLTDLVGQVEVDVEPQKSIMTLDEAIAANLDPYAEFTYGYGEVDAAFAQAERVIKTVTETAAQEHFYLEPLAVLVIPRQDGGYLVYASCQGIWEVKLAVAEVTGCAAEKVQVRLPAVGGGFGGKIEQPLFLAAQAAIAAQKTGQPVKLLYSRDEDLLYTVKRHPSKIIMKGGESSIRSVWPMAP